MSHSHCLCPLCEQIEHLFYDQGVIEIDHVDTESLLQEKPPPPVKNHDGVLKPHLRRLYEYDPRYWTQRIRDTTAGFVCYKRTVLENIKLDEIRFVGYAFQIEMKFKAYLRGFNIVEVPVIFTDRTKGKSKMSGSIISEAVFGVISMKVKSLFQNK